MSSPAAGAKRIGGDWVESVDKATGKVYYANTKTKETSWKFPAELSATAGEWVEKQDAKTGKTYYYNPATRETSWKKPASTADGAGDWKKKTDSSTGKTYFYNRVTKVTRWDMPPGFEDAAAAEDDEESTVPEEDKDNRFGKLRAFAQEQGKSKVAEKKKKQGKKGETSNTFLKVVEDAVEAAKLDEYANSHFNMNRKGLLKSKTTAEKMLKFKPEPIRTSLRRLNEELSNEAVQTFKNLTGYMGDRPSKKPPLDHAKKILLSTLAAPEELRDEIYCQLCKQTTENPGDESLKKGWELFALCLATFPPSTEFMPYLRTFFDEHRQGFTETVQTYANYCFDRLPKAMMLGPRREIPTPEEMEAVRELKPLIIRVFFLDGTFKTVPVEPWTTAKELDTTLSQKLRIINDKPYATFEVAVTEEEERVLDEDERILDLCATWQRLQSEERAKKGANSAVEEFKFVYKVRLFFDVEEEDIEGVSMMFIQAVHDVVDARYPCSEQDHITLAALQLQQEYGDYSSENCKQLESQLAKYLPAKYLGKGREEELSERIGKVYGKIAGYSQQEAKLSYLDLVKSWEIYGSAYFFVEPQGMNDMPAEVVLAINNRSILVVDPETKDFLAKYPYSEVVTWGHSGSSFVVVTGNLVRQTKVYFKTESGKEMNALVHLYVNAIIDTTDPDVDDEA